MSDSKKPASEGRANEIHDVLVKSLKDALDGMDKGEPNAALLNVARQFLRDNDITCNPSTPNPELDALAERMSKENEDLDDDGVPKDLH